MNHGWEKKRLGDVCQINFGKRIVAKDTPPGPYYVYGGGGATFTTMDYNRENCMIVSRFAMSPECVRFVRGRFFLNDSGLSVQSNNGLLTQEFVEKYLWAIQPQIYNLGRGAAQKNLNTKSFSEMPIPIPAVEVQRQIVSELDKINEMLEVKRGQLKDLDMLSQSLFYEMFGEPIENPQGWDMKQIQEFAKTTAGGTPSKSHPEYYNGGKIPWLRSGEVCKMNISNTELCITDLGMQNSSAKLVPVNSVVVAMYGATAAQVGVIRSEMTLNQAISAIFPNSHTKPIFLYFCLSGLKESLLKVAHGAAQPNISQAIIKSTKIILPPIELQNEFSVRVEAIEEQKRVIESTISDLEVLLASRMDYWFND